MMSPREVGVIAGVITIIAVFVFQMLLLRAEARHRKWHTWQEDLKDPFTLCMFGLTSLFPGFVAFFLAVNVSVIFRCQAFEMRRADELLPDACETAAPLCVQPAPPSPPPSLVVIPLSELEKSP